MLFLFYIIEEIDSLEIINRSWVEELNGKSIMLYL